MPVATSAASMAERVKLENVGRPCWSSLAGLGGAMVCGCGGLGVELAT